MRSSRLWLGLHPFKFPVRKRRRFSKERLRNETLARMLMAHASRRGNENGAGEDRIVLRSSGSVSLRQTDDGSGKNAALRRRASGREREREDGDRFQKNEEEEVEEEEDADDEEETEGDESDDDDDNNDEDDDENDDDDMEDEDDAKVTHENACVYEVK